MKTRVLLLSFMLAFLTLGISWSQELPSEAYKDNQVRFTVISDGAIRIEWSKDGDFVDSPSFVAINRKYTLVKYKVNNNGNRIEVITSKIKLSYKKGSGKITDKNLTISSLKSIKPSFIWTLGMKQKENLKGTYRTLDGFDGEFNNKQKMPIENGLLAKDGWTFIDDSHDFLFDNSDWPWVEKRKETDNQDFYFMAYGHDYKQALKDFTLFAGRIPLPPRYAFGYWWSRYWNYSDNEIRNLVNRFHTYNIPLDVLVIDMDWHYTEKGKGGWTGYTWNRELFPEPNKFLKYLKDSNLKVTLNLHPADGIASYEEKYPELAKYLDIDPASGKNMVHPTFRVI